ncbi:MAG: diguanylate cyclase [Acidobacteriota bacterium]
MQLTARDSSLPVPRRHQSPWRAVALAAAALLMVFALDRATDVAPVQHLYYLPIILAARHFKMRGGIVAALAAVLLYHAANPHLLTLVYEESDLVQIVLFLAVGAVAGRLTADAERLHHLAMTDDLTGLHNLRSFERWLAAMVSDARATGEPVALLVLDLDRLKSLNDQHGHLAGAEAVRTVGRLIAERVPEGAVACRYGGDEFVIALPRGGQLAAQHLADDLCRVVRAAAPTLANRAFPAGTLSISIGLASAAFAADPASGEPAPSDAEAGESLFRDADAALYQAKAHGRNQVFARPYS